MKKTSLVAALCAGALMIPVAAVAKKPEDPGSKGRTNSEQKHAEHQQQQGEKHKQHSEKQALLKSGDKRCKLHKVGFNGSGFVNSSSLTQSQGAATPNTSDDRWSGTITVDVTKANHRAAKGVQTITVTDIKVKWGKGVTNPPAAGSRIKLHGKITKTNKKCDQTGAGVITLRKVDIKVAKPYAI